MWKVYLCFSLFLLAVFFCSSSLGFTSEANLTTTTENLEISSCDITKVLSLAYATDIFRDPHSGRWGGGGPCKSAKILRLSVKNIRHYLSNECNRRQARVNIALICQGKSSQSLARLSISVKCQSHPPRICHRISMDCHGETQYVRCPTHIGREHMPVVVPRRASLDGLPRAPMRAACTARNHTRYS